MGNPLPVHLSQECRKAQKILTEFVDPAHGGLDRVIPVSVLKKAQGFAIFSVARLGFLVSARAGSGVVIARLPDDSWSAPSALGLGGLGGGFNAGLDVTDFLIILNSKQAVRSFMATGSLQLGGNLSVAVGPLGRAAEASGALNSSGNLAAMYSYSKSKGLYGGVSVEGTVLVDRSDANSKAYNRNVSAKQILSGSVEVPSFAQPLISTIEKFTYTGEVKTGMEAGSRGDDDDDYRYRFGGGGGGGVDDIDSLDRDMQGARVSSPSSTRRKNQFVEDYDNHRPGDYAFGGTSGGSHTNSPTRTRKSFLGGMSSSTAKGTDYTQDIFKGSDYSAYEASPSSPNKSRIPFVRSRSSTGSGSIFGDEGGTYAASGVKVRRDAPAPPYQTEASNGRGSRSHRATSSFPTRFNNENTDEEVDDDLRSHSHRISEEATSSIKSRDSWDDEALRRKPHADFSRAASNDLLDFELDRSAVTQRQAPRSTEKDLMNFDEPYSQPTMRKTNNFGGATRKTGSGMDELDKELQARSSMSSNDSLPPMVNGNGNGADGWRSDYGVPVESQSSRPKMHARTSSTQKILNRLRGNSQSSKNNAFANIETWDQKYSSPSRTSPSPDRFGGGGGGPSSTSPAFNKSSTPTGYRKSSTPVGYKTSTTPTGFKTSTTPTGFRSSTTPTGFSTDAEVAVAQVLASFDFDGQEEDDLSFKRGDVIEVVKRTANRDDWWVGRKGAKMGNFPANYTVDV